MARAKHGWMVGVGILLLAGAAAWLLLTPTEDGGPSTDADLADAERGVTEGEHLDGVVSPTGASAGLSGRVEEGALSEDAPHGPVEVRVTGPHGDPLPDVRIQVQRSDAFIRATLGSPVRRDDADAAAAAESAASEEDELPVARTDADGRVRFDDLPWDGSVEVVASKRGSTRLTVAGETRWAVVVDALGGNRRSVSLRPRAPRDRRATVKGPKVHLALRDGLPLSVRFEHAEDGEAPGIPWHVSPGFLPPPEEGLPVQATQFVDAGPGDNVSFRIRADTRPDERRAHPAKAGATLSPQARRLETWVPLRPLADIRIVLPQDVELGSKSTWRFQWRVGPEGARTVPEVDGFRRLAFTDLPWVPGAPVQVMGVLGTRGSVSAQGRFSWTEPELVLEGTFKAAKASSTASRVAKERAKLADALRARAEALEQIEADTVKLELDLEAVRGQIVRYRSDASPRDQGAGPGTDPEGFGSLRVEVRDEEGEPVQDALVQVQGRSGRTDRKGVATLRRVPAGETWMGVFGAGASWREEIEIHSQKFTERQVTSRRGGTLRVQVEDAEGHTLPFARLEITQRSGMAYANVDGGVQRLDLFTDRLGRLDLHQLEADRVTIVAHYGGYTATWKVTLEEGEARDMRLQIPMGEPPAPSGRAASKEQADRDAQARANTLEQARREMMEALKRMKELREREGR